jgi:hypothetical protein
MSGFDLCLLSVRLQAPHLRIALITSHLGFCTSVNGLPGFLPSLQSPVDLWISPKQNPLKIMLQ